MTKKLVLPALLACVILWFGGCAGTSAPSNFYILTPVSEKAPAGDRMEKLTIGIGPVALPAYLDRPQIVSRSGSNSLKLDEFRRWGEPLKDSFTRALVENVSSLLATEYVFSFPYQAVNKLDYRVIMSVTRFDRDATGPVVLNARWIVAAERDERKPMPFTAKESSISQAVAGDDYDTIAAAMSAAVGKLSQEIAQTIITFER